MGIKLGSKRLSRSLSKLLNGGTANNGGDKECKKINVGDGKIEWEMRPGGMLVQKRVCKENTSECVIIVRVTTVSQWRDVPIPSISTFGELKMILSLVTNLAPNEQRLLYKGKEREDHEYLHMVGVKDNDKILLLEDPAIKERKLVLGLATGRVIEAPFHTISV